MGVSGEVDHETARGIAAFCVNTKHPFQVLGRAYLDIAHLAPDPDADLIDEDPLPDGWEVVHVCGEDLGGGDDVWRVSGVYRSSFIRRLRDSSKEAIREAWSFHHGF